jgi:hypothetical protein
MKRISIICVLLFAGTLCNSQSMQNNTWILGGYHSVLDFNSGSAISTKLIGTNNDPFVAGHPCISDSNGALLFICNGAVVFDKNIANIAGGNRILHNAWYDSLQLQRGIRPNSCTIIPKGDNQYYIFSLAASDSMIVNDWYNYSTDTPEHFDQIMYCVVDMNANNGQGAVIKKRIPIFSNDSIIGDVGLTACRAANGEDWWLTSQCKLQNSILKFYVTKDTILGPFRQNFESPYWHRNMYTGQASFSKDGSKYAFVSWIEQKIFVADFNRCTGTFSNPITMNVPPTSTLPCFDQQTGISYEYNTLGCCFSENNQFLYFARYYSIYQIDLNDADTSTKWYRVQGLDTTDCSFAGYNNIALGPDNKVYIGNRNPAPYMTYINEPNQKGPACNVMPRGIKWTTPNTWAGSPPNNPNYALGKDSSGCWPLDIFPTPKNIDFSIFPNPTSGQINITYKITDNDNARLIITDLLGQELQNIPLVNSAQTLNTELQLPNYGLYLYKFIVNNKLMQAGKLQFVR